MRFNNYKKRLKKKKRTNPQFESLDEYLLRGGSIKKCFTATAPNNRLLFSSGHFGPKRSNRGAQPGRFW